MDKNKPISINLASPPVGIYQIETVDESPVSDTNCCEGSCACGCAEHWSNKLKYPGVFKMIHQKTNERDIIYITRVIYNDPATVVFWSDGTKTTSRCSDMDEYNPETGFALCWLKKMLGGEKLTAAMGAWLPDDDSRNHFDINIKGVRYRMKHGKE